MCCKCYSPILTLKGNICLLDDDRSSNANKFKHPFNIYYFLNITDELIKK